MNDQEESPCKHENGKSDHTPSGTSKNSKKAKEKTEAEPWPGIEDGSVVEPLRFSASPSELGCVDSPHVTFGDLRTTIRVLKTIASLNDLPRRRVNETSENHDNVVDEGLERYRDKILRPFRLAFSSCSKIHERIMYNIGDDRNKAVGNVAREEYQQLKYEKNAQKRRKLAEKIQNRKYIESTQLRQGRIEKLRQLQESARHEEEQKLLLLATDVSTSSTMIVTSAPNLLPSFLLVPDGHVETGATSAATETTDTTAKSTLDTPTAELPQLRSCYVCKVRYRQLHQFYDQLCPKCADLNWTKRHATADLTGKVAVVTGSRVKIGLQTCLKLLRAGCTVIATTRFPQSAVLAYQKEPDFDQWKDRLQVMGLDLRDVAGVELFCLYLQSKFRATGIDILINNACQTVRRPRGYYMPLVQQEQEIWKRADDVHRSVLSHCSEFESLRSSSNSSHREITQSVADQISTEAELGHGDKGQEQELIPATKSALAARSATGAIFETSGLSHSATMSQVVVLPEDGGDATSLVATAATDINGHPIDLRTTNSWLLKLDEVSTPEIMECMLVNTIAPFVLNSKLQPLMMMPSGDDDYRKAGDHDRPRRRPDRFIVNVSAMEGKFYRYKMPNHPHTNMAKAALNMMTRTSAQDLADKHRIYMNSVDTGWINDENPLHKASQTAVRNNFQTPIDEIDAAARILDPIFSAINCNDSPKPKDGESSSITTPIYGKFLKDYHESEW
jgi:NAD(P)-dependent dehydrogenase (short-subunit alcohol dehydrogenase family)